MALRSSGSVTVAELETRFGVSPMTARRDLDELERRGVVRRTHGGAVLPTIAAHEDSFSQRLTEAEPAKRRLADEAVADLAPGESVFLDSSTTTYYVARRIADLDIALTVLTNSLPVMELLFSAGRPELEVVGVGGTLRRLTRSFVGPYAVRTIQGHFADRLFLSVKGVSESGALTDAEPLEAEVKRAMIAQAARSTLLIDRPKLGVRGLSVIGPVSALTEVIGYGLNRRESDALAAYGVIVRAVGARPAA